MAGELWTFRAGAQLAVGNATDLDASPQTVTAAVASDMIRAGKCEAVCVRSLDDPDLELVRERVEDDLPAEDAA